MKTAVRSAVTEADIWINILYPDGHLPREVASAILGFTFTSKQRRRMRELSSKARDGNLTSQEDFEIQNFERVGDLLSILKSKARQILKKQAF